MTSASNPSTTTTETASPDPLAMGIGWLKRQPSWMLHLGFLLITVSFCTWQVASTSLDCAKIAEATVEPRPDLLFSSQTARVTWGAYNCGTTNWSGYEVLRTGGAIGPESFYLGDWPPGKLGTMYVEFDLPAEPGTYPVEYRVEGQGRVFITLWANLTVQQVPTR
jgi:hypothetical protein